MTPLIRELVSLDAEVALSCIWFDIGTTPEHAQQEEDAALRNNPLPFERCAVCGIDADGHKFLMMIIASHISTGEQMMVINGWVMWNTGYRKAQGFSLTRQGEDLRIGSAEGIDQTPPPFESCRSNMAILGYWLNRSNPTGYRAEPKRNSITNKRRASKGKPPLIYDWHTVVIEPPAPKSEHQGGTHATPRQHERRGHWRTCANGARVWVRNCTVGDASRGTIFKDYKI